MGGVDILSHFLPLKMVHIAWTLELERSVFKSGTLPSSVSLGCTPKSLDLYFLSYKMEAPELA